MADFFPPVVVTFLASTVEAVAQLDRLAGTYETMGAAVKAATAEASAASATMGEAVTASTSEVMAANDRALASFATLSAQAERSAEQVYVSMAGMAAKTQASLAELEAAEARATAATAAFGESMDAAAVRSEAAATRFAGIQKAGLLIGAAGLVAGGVMVHMAADFETATNKLVTSAGESHDAIGMVRDGLLAMSSQVGVGADDLAAALYKVESAGYHGAAGLGLLKAAEQGAKAEGADATTVADALSSALRDYYPHAKSAAEVTAASTDVMSKLIGATSAGKMTFNELAGALNSILPVSSAAKISLSDTLGVLASMTVHGISAQQATENMADAIRHLQAPTLAMSKAMATLGVDSVDLAAHLGERGLSGTMQLLSDRVKNAMPPGSDKVILELGTALSKSTPKVQELGQAVLQGSITMKQFIGEMKGLDPLSAKQAQSFATLAGSYHQLGTTQLSGAEVMQTYGGMMQKLMGDATGLKVALMTTGDNAQYTSDAIATVSGSTADAAGNVKGWSEIQGTFNQKLSEAKAGAQALGIAIGEKLLPVATKIIDVFAQAAHWFSEHKWAATALAWVLGGALVIGLAAATAAVWLFTIALLANPATWIVLGIMVLIAAIILLATHWKQVWHAITEVAGTAWNWLKTNVFQPIGDFFVFLYDIYIKPWVDLWKWAWKFVGDIAKSVADWLDEHVFKYLGRTIDVLKGWLGDFANFWKDVWEGAGKILRWVYDNVIAPIADLIKEAFAFAKDPVGHMMGTDITTGMTGGLKLPHHQAGGWVEGALGTPQLIVAHAGEYVLSHDMLAGRREPDLGVGYARAMTGATSTRTGGGGATMIVVNVAGSIWSERDLQKKIQDIALRYNQRNSSNGLNFGVA